MAACPRARRLGPREERWCSRDATCVKGSSTSRYRRKIEPAKAPGNLTCTHASQISFLRVICGGRRLARCVSAQAQRKPDLQNAVEDRVDADDVEQRQCAGPGLGYQNQSEDDRE